MRPKTVPEALSNESALIYCPFGAAPEAPSGKVPPATDTMDAMTPRSWAHRRLGITGVPGLRTLKTGKPRNRSEFLACPGLGWSGGQHTWGPLGLTSPLAP